MVFWKEKSQERVIFLITQTIMVTFVLSSEPAGIFRQLLFIGKSAIELEIRGFYESQISFGQASTFTNVGSVKGVLTN